MLSIERSSNRQLVLILQLTSASAFHTSIENVVSEWGHVTQIGAIFGCEAAHQFNKHRSSMVSRPLRRPFTSQKQHFYVKNSVSVMVGTYYKELCVRIAPG